MGITLSVRLMLIEMLAQVGLLWRQTPSLGWCLVQIETGRRRHDLCWLETHLAFPLNPSEQIKGRAARFQSAEK